MVKNLPAMWDWVQSLGREGPLEEGMATHSSILVCLQSHAQRSLAGYSPWGCKGSDTTEWLTDIPLLFISRFANPLHLSYSLHWVEIQYLLFYSSSNSKPRRFWINWAQNLKQTPRSWCDPSTAYCGPKWMILKHRLLVPDGNFEVIYYTLLILLLFFFFHFSSHWVSLVAQLVKNPPTMWVTCVRSLGWEDPLEKGKAPHSSILAWRIPWTI